LIQAAAISNKVMGDAIRDINAEAEKRIAASVKQEADSRAAEKIAVQANAASAKRADLFADRLAKAGKAKPDCASLLALDLEKVCGVKSR
jgi:phage-related tail protein